MFVPDSEFGHANFESLFTRTNSCDLPSSGIRCLEMKTPRISLILKGFVHTGHGNDFFIGVFDTIPIPGGAFLSSDIKLVVSSATSRYILYRHVIQNMCPHFVIRGASSVARHIGHVSSSSSGYIDSSLDTDSQSTYKSGFCKME